MRRVLHSRDEQKKVGGVRSGGVCAKGGICVAAEIFQAKKGKGVRACRRVCVCVLYENFSFSKINYVNINGLGIQPVSGRLNINFPNVDL